MTEYFVNATVWSALGLTIGIIIGTGIRVKVFGVNLDPRGRDRLMGAVLISIALISTAQSLIFQRHQRVVTECQVNYNSEFQETLRERTAGARKDRENVNRMVQTVLGAKSREESRKALELYISTNQAIERERQTQRYPTGTSRSCK